MTARILAVDDEPNITKLVSATLTARGYEVITASDGVEGLAKAESRKPDLIVLDIMMPEMDGKEMRRKLASKPETRDIPILFLSAVGEYENQLDSMESGFVDFLTKPFAPAELADRVAGILDPKKRDAYQKERGKREAKLRAIVEIMHRERAE